MKVLNKKLDYYLQNKYVSPPTVTSVTVFIISFVSLFIQPYIGMADNGDYFRILYSNGLYFNDPNYQSSYLGYFVKNYGILQYYNENGATLFSSQSIFIKLSIMFNEWFYSTVDYDIRFQAAIYLILYTAGIYLLIEALTWKLNKKRGFFISLLAIFIFADTAYTAYFNSFYSESIVFISLIYLTASGLLLYRNRYNKYVMMIIFLISSLLLTTSKQQNAPVGVIIAVFGVFFIFMYKSKAYRFLTAACLAVVMLAGVGSYLLISDEFKNINKFHAMNRGVLMNSNNPEQDLEFFGIDQQFSVLNGDIYYLPYTTVDVNSNLLIENFYNKYGYVKILGFYFTHPDKAIEMLDLAAKNGFTIRPDAMGNFEASVGKEFGAKTSYFSLYSEFKKRMAPKTIGFILIWSIVLIGVLMPSFIYAIKNKKWNEIMRLPLIMMLICIGLSAMVVSIVGAGDADLAKHQFLFTACFDIVTFVFVASWISKQLWSSDISNSS